jgi:hypothetical protein
MSSKFLMQFLHLEPDPYPHIHAVPDPAAQINADPYGFGSGSETLPLVKSPK